MIFTIGNSSDFWPPFENPVPGKAFLDGEDWKIKIDTLEELLQIIKDAGHPIIVDPDKEIGFQLEIYDTYRE